MQAAINHRLWRQLAGLAIVLLLLGCAPQPANSEALEDLFATQQSGQMVEVAAQVKKVLSDDTRGSRHQRFIIVLASGLTVLVAHNIDLAPRVAELNTGDEVVIYGQYEWNQKGGVLHWTHRDPDGSHPAGWIEHAGRRYD